MDRYDPNDWNKRFVKSEPDFCMSVLRSINETVIQCLEDQEYAPAVAGMDRILNGLITFINAGADMRPHVCFFSWMEGMIIAFGLSGLESRRKENAIKVLEDARDFAKGETTKRNVSALISEIKGTSSLLELRDEVDPDFPESVIETLNNLQEKLVW